MKRSEMIKIIEDYLDLRSEDSDLHPNNKDASEYIIGCCETWGMEAPLWAPDFTEYGEPNGFGIQERTWEDEDDTK